MTTWEATSHLLRHDSCTVPYINYIPPISLIEGRVLETHLNMERVRFLRAGLLTPLPGGPGIVPAGITTGARGASLKRDDGAGNARILSLA